VIAQESSSNGGASGIVHGPFGQSRRIHSSMDLAVV
jgi:hypothetical protein